MAYFKDDEWGNVAICEGECGAMVSSIKALQAQGWQWMLDSAPNGTWNVKVWRENPRDILLAEGPTMLVAVQNMAEAVRREYPS
jgi:hypothetical protein